jgi:hypothetical protein
MVEAAPSPRPPARSLDSVRHWCRVARRQSEVWVVSERHTGSCPQPASSRSTAPMHFSILPCLGAVHSPARLLASRPPPTFFVVPAAEGDGAQHVGDSGRKDTGQRHLLACSHPQPLLSGFTTPALGHTPRHCQRPRGQASDSSPLAASPATGRPTSRGVGRQVASGGRMAPEGGSP